MNVQSGGGEGDVIRMIQDFGLGDTHWLLYSQG